MKQTAWFLRISLTTVMTHVRRAYAKLHVRNRTSAILALTRAERDEHRLADETFKPSVGLTEKLRFCPACGCNFENTLQQPIFMKRETAVSGKGATSYSSWEIGVGWRV